MAIAVIQFLAELWIQKLWKKNFLGGRIKFYVNTNLNSLTWIELYENPLENNEKLFNYLGTFTINF